MRATETGPDGAEIDPFNRTIRYPAISRALPQPISDEVKLSHASWVRKLDDLLKKMRAEHSTAVERQFVGRWAPE